MYLLDLHDIVDWVNECWASTRDGHETNPRFEEMFTSTFKNDVSRSLAKTTGESYPVSSF
jgi:hypothetical protein